ncbi:MAG: tRNA uridine-5-carboxymethylaminomethyl(34) synthesis GTPase MnmE [Marinomonas sp.]
MIDTIFALSSGAPPAAIAVIRVSGPQAGSALTALSARDLPSRRPVLAKLSDLSGQLLDEALVLWLPGPNTATGEDLAELHCHGGRAVVAAVESALEDMVGLRRAQPGEFTRRAFANGRIDLAEAEGLADLLSAETELQRSAAVAMAGGGFSAQVEEWRSAVLRFSAEVEAALDFSDEDDVSAMRADFAADLRGLSDNLDEWLSRPRAERLGEGYRVVLAGPPNAGKSTLFNALLESEAAITSPTAGTTRDVIERSFAMEGVPFTLVDTAGLRGTADDSVEAEGIARAEAQLTRADLVLWLGEETCGPDGAWEVQAQADKPELVDKTHPKAAVSAKTGEGMDALKSALVEHARGALPKPGEAALNARQHALVDAAQGAVSGAAALSDPLLIAEELRNARVAFDRLIGRATTEDMLDALFGRFCIGK